MLGVAMPRAIYSECHTFVVMLCLVLLSVSFHIAMPRVIILSSTFLNAIILASFDECLFDESGHADFHNDKCCLLCIVILSFAMLSL